jgi:DnaD/phage-associated family protein
MKGFGGFPARGRLIKVPGLFFSELLPWIDSLPEIKVTLYCFWRLQQKEGGIGYLRRREIAADEVFMSGLGAREDIRQAALSDGLERAVARGTLLHVHVEGSTHQDDLYFVNTPRGRAAVEGIEQGRWTPGVDQMVPLEVTVERPNVFTLYEQHIGPLTPHIADTLRDMEETYPAEWIEEAIAIAAEQNKRNLAYFQAILRRWETEGRGAPDGSATDSKRYISGKYGDEIEH